MRLILDTNAVLWTTFEPERIRESTRALLADAENEVSYSVTALWEIAIKNGTRRPLCVDPFALRGLLQEEGFRELPITAEHALAVSGLPRLHGDPFDRILIAQAMVERMTLVTSDRVILRYPGVKLLPA